MSHLNLLHYFPINVTIATSTTISEEVNLNGMTCVGIFTPASLTGTGLKFQAAREPGGTGVSVVDTAGADISYTIAAAKFVEFDADALIGVQNIRIVCGTGQAANRVFYLACRPVA